MSVTQTEFTFELPEKLIALRPVDPQHDARLLVVRSDGSLEDTYMMALPDLLTRGDTLVFNETCVLPAALKGIRKARNASGRDVEVTTNLAERQAPNIWLTLSRPGKRLQKHDRIIYGPSLTAEIIEKKSDGAILLRFNRSGPALDGEIQRIGAMPIPPYIARRRAADAHDAKTYQTRFARGAPVSVAAPTAGLHFTETLLRAIDNAGINRETVRLQIGLGTFAPLKAEQLETGRLHEEWRELSADTARRLNQRRSEGHRCIAVGTTSLRTLESSVDANKQLYGTSGPTDIFIRPGFDFSAIGGLVTNFHLPGSSLFMLVCAIMGTDIMQAAYAHAIKENYRFYSYGDACLLLR